MTEQGAAKRPKLAATEEEEAKSKDQLEEEEAQALSPFSRLPDPSVAGAPTSCLRWHLPHRSTLGATRINPSVSRRSSTLWGPRGSSGRTVGT